MEWKLHPYNILYIFNSSRFTNHVRIDTSYRDHIITYRKYSIISILESSFIITEAEIIQLGDGLVMNQGAGQQEGHINSVTISLISSLLICSGIPARGASFQLSVLLSLDSIRKDFEFNILFNTVWRFFFFKLGKVFFPETQTNNQCQCKIIMHP